MSARSASKSLPLHPHAEMQCRRCDVHCDKVVYPGSCLEKSCPFVYSYEAWGHTYVGCMQKVYEVEIDLDMLRAAERRSAARSMSRSISTSKTFCMHPTYVWPHASYE